MKVRRLRRRSLLHDLIGQGVRITPQRRAIIETLQEAQSHLDAAALLDRARRRDVAVNRATVYRTIELLKKRRLIDELDLMHLEGEKHFYEAKTLGEHLHLACLECGAIIEYKSPALEALKAQISKHCDFEIGVTRLEVGGRCRQCRDAKTNPRNAS